MNDFVPRGYLTLGQAVDRVAQSLFVAEWQDATPSDSERTALVRQTQATQLLRADSAGRRGMRGRGMPSRGPDRQELQQRAADTAETRAAKAKLKGRERIRKKAVAPLQQALFAGEVSAFILSEGGSMYEVPTRVWGSAEATNVFRTGKAESSTRGYSYGASGTREGRVLLEEGSLDAWLTPAEPRPAPTTVAATHEGGPEAESPDPYRTGLPGRPSIAHLIEQEFERRAEEDIVCSTLAAEARELRAWASRSHPTAPPLAQTSVENQLREEYQRHKALKNNPGK